MRYPLLYSLGAAWLGLVNIAQLVTHLLLGQTPDTTLSVVLSVGVVLMMIASKLRLSHYAKMQLERSGASWTQPLQKGNHGDRKAHRAHHHHAGAGANPQPRARASAAARAGARPGPAAEPAAEPTTRGTRPLVAWKALVVRSSGLLTGPMYDTSAWPPRERFEATCGGGPGGGGNGYGHSAPSETCNCGVHATLIPNQAAGYVAHRYKDSVCVVAEIYLWGEIIVNDRGYRAQYAYPKQITILTPPTADAGLLTIAQQVCERIYKLYGVPTSVLGFFDFCNIHQGVGQEVQP